MRTIDAATYEVNRNENIVITVTPVNFDDSLFSVRANLDGEIWEPEPDTENEPRFEFTVNKPVDDIHTALFEFNFIAGTPDNSRYDVVVQGDGDEGDFTIRKTTANKEPAIQFFVVS